MRTAHAIILVSVIFINRSSGIAQQPVYPLHIGDRWQYSLVPGTARIDRDSLMPNTHRYALVTSEIGPDRWERTAGNQVFWYDTQTEQEYLRYDFSLSIGDTVNIIPRGADSTIIYFTGTGTYDLFGVTRRWWSFFIDITHVIDDEEGITITDTLGLTRIETVWYSSELQGAVINGVLYGTVDVGNASEILVQRPRLSQNYPNPFNPKTTISYQLPTRSPVTLKVFDLLGREVATLVNGVEDAGLRSAQLDAGELASGMYFYRLTVGGSVQTMKMMLQK